MGSCSEDDLYLSLVFCQGDCLIEEESGALTKTTLTPDLDVLGNCMQQ